MMYHVVQGYGLLYKELYLTLPYVSQLENSSLTNWENDIQNILYDYFTEYLLNGNTEESRLLSNNVVQVINKIIYLRSVNNTHCIGGTDPDHEPFEQALYRIRETAIHERVCDC